MAGWTKKALCAYVAGFVDSDGCIGISQNGKKAKTYRLRISLFNNNPEPLEFIQNHFNGTLHEREPGQGRFAKKTQYILVWQAKIAEGILRQIIPYMLAKKRQAELMLKFRQQQNEEGFNGHTDKSWQKKYAIEMKELNSRFRGGNHDGLDK